MGKSTVKRIRNDLIEGLEKAEVDHNQAIEEFLKSKGIVTKCNNFVTHDECRNIAREEAEEVVEQAKRGY